MLVIVIVIELWSLPRKRRRGADRRERKATTKSFPAIAGESDNEHEHDEELAGSSLGGSTGTAYSGGEAFLTEGEAFLLGP